MIISASRRTDIPMYYSDWFFNRIKEKYVFTRNPMNTFQVSKIKLSPDVVDCIVFWTKNPEPMISRLHELNDYNYYFQFTLNSYGKDIEPNLPYKNDIIIPNFQRLSNKIGSEKVIWRYDPIFLNQHYTIEYHIEYFDKLASKLKDYTHKCIFSYIDLYRNTKQNVKGLEILEITNNSKKMIAREFSKIANSYGLDLETCAEDINLDEFNIKHSKCIDDKLIEKISGFHLNVNKDKNQRAQCGCVDSIDIGMYNTCLNGCRYCYANYNTNIVKRNFAKHDPKSPLIFGQLTNKDIVKERAVKSFKDLQLKIY